MSSPSISYIYKCKNRKCKSFKKETRLPDSPADHVQKNGELPRCSECQSPLKFARMDYPKEVFRNPRGPIDLSMSQEDLQRIIRAAEKTVRDGVDPGKSS